jgi:uncharacterized protein (TIGR02118 family)
MMYRLTVLYGHPANPDEFLRYYREVHLPIAKSMHGFSGWTIGLCEPVAPGEKPPYFMIVGLYADTREAIETILASPEGKASIADVANFATGGATFFFDREEVLIPVALND